MALRRRGLRVALWSTLGLMLVLVVLIAFDEVWLRPLIQSYVRQHSGRRFDFEALQVGLDRTLRPTLRFKNLNVQNAPWASSAQPLIRAADFSATFTWESLWQRPMTITRMVMVDADVDLERQADGLRNWRLSHPEDRGAGRVRVLSLDAQRSRVRFVHRGLDLEIVLETTPLPADKASAVAGGPELTKSLTLRGSRNGVAFDGQAATSAVLTFFDTGESFSVQGELTAQHARLIVQGTAHDLIQLAGLDGDLHVSGHHVGDLAAVFAAGPLPLPDYAAKVDAHLKKVAEHWSVTGLTARLGDSDVSGTVDYRSNKASGARPALRATLVSERLNAAQLRPHGTVSPTQDSLHSALDAEVDWKIADVQGLPVPVNAIHATASSRGGHWTLAPIELRLAGGHVDGKATLDTASASAKATLDLRLIGLQLDQLGARNVGGKLDALVTLHSAGDSIATLVSAASGSASAVLADASLPATLEAKLGLDGGRWLGAVVAGDERSAVVCSVMQVQLKNGIARVRRLALETGNVLLNGAGSVDFSRRTVDLTVTPYRKHAALLALDKSVHVDGPFDAVKVGLVATPETARRDSCVPAATP
jgi:uncharacterized protein involved in outer membrane biogenesis